jgi:hypothetical protein
MILDCWLLLCRIPLFLCIFLVSSSCFCKCRLLIFILFLIYIYLPVNLTMNHIIFLVLRYSDWDTYTQLRLTTLFWETDRVRFIWRHCVMVTDPALYSNINWMRFLVIFQFFFRVNAGITWKIGWLIPSSFLLISYSISPQNRIILEKLFFAQLVKFPAFYGTRRFITVFTRARYTHHSQFSEYSTLCELAVETA